LNVNLKKYGTTDKEQPRCIIECINYYYFLVIWLHLIDLCLHLVDFPSNVIAFC
jgi:hypothetical protein